MYQHRQNNKTKEVMPKIFFAQTCFSSVPKKALGKDFVEKICSKAWNFGLLKEIVIRGEEHRQRQSYLHLHLFLFTWDYAASGAKAMGDS